MVVCLLYVTPVIAVGPGVHFFDCKECHLSGRTINELGGDNVCLKCHYPTAGNVTLNGGAPAGLDGHTEGHFTSGDASNVFGHGSGQPSADQTSHTWSAPTDTLAAAGAAAPLYSEHPEFYSRYGISTGKLTCSRCHNPHEAAETNPKLLIKGVDSADVMCRACHALWDQADNHGWLTHPIVNNYSTSVATHPDKYRATLNNKDNSGIKLVDGGVSCPSCHGIHFVDSDATTVDGIGQTLSQSDGKLLSGNGPGQTDKSSLCQTCHTYKEHGDDTGEKPGCLICHSGHSYDSDYPNYFVLRKSATTTTYNTVTGLDYSSPSVLDSGLKYTFWNDQTDGTADGYCEKCHGDAVTIGAGAGNYHIATAVCTDCHTHMGSIGGSFSADCDACHAYPPVWQSHGTHLDSGRIANVPSCATCHKTSEHLNDLSEIRFDPDDLRVDSGTYSGTEPSRYTVAGGYNSTTPAYGQCNNLYCHSNVQGQADPTQSPDYKTPTWGSSIVSSCKACHDGGAHPGSSPAMDTGSHTAHLAYIFGRTVDIMSCQACHYLGETTTCTPCHFNHGGITYNRLDKHVNGEIDIDFHPTATGASAAYSGDSVPQTAYGSCSTTYCHSLGELNTTSGQLPAAYSGNLYTNPAWGGGSLDCNGCHGRSTSDGMPDYTSGSGGSEDANSHAPHVANNQLGCQLCHYGTTEDGTTISYDGHYMQHVDGVNTDVEFETGRNPDASYNSAKFCGNTYCHSDGTTVATGHYIPEVPVNQTPAWGTAGDGFTCDDCHGYPPDYGNYDPKANSHVRHDYPWLSCEGCHYTTTTDGVTITNFANHMNGVYDVSPSPTYDSQYDIERAGCPVIINFAGPAVDDSSVTEIPEIGIWFIAG